MSGSTVDRLTSLAHLDRAGTDTFAAPPSGDPGRMFGGEVAARALAAAQCTVAPDRAVHVVQAGYLRPGDPSAPMRLRVERLRDGRAFSMRRVDVEQRDKLIFTATLSFHVGSTAFDHHDRMPRVPPPEELADLAAWTGGPSFWPDWVVGDPALDLRPVPCDGVKFNGLEHTGAGAGVRALWCRAAGPVPDDPALHACLAMYVSDLTLVASIRLPHETSERKTWLMTSLNHTVWFHRPFRVDEWHLVVQRSSRAADGRGLAHGQVFTRNGVLVSSLAQEGLASRIPGDK
jgi:acyl-CoA thioesterase-2